MHILALWQFLLKYFGEHYVCQYVTAVVTSFIKRRFCWLASNLIHMLLKYHNHDYHQLDNESDVSAAIWSSQPAPGIYTASL